VHGSAHCASDRALGQMLASSASEAAQQLFGATCHDLPSDWRKLAEGFGN